VQEAVAVGEQRATKFASTVPPHFAGFGLQTYPQRTSGRRNALARVRKWVESTTDTWLLLTGLYGTGKTSLAIGVATEMLRLCRAPLAPSARFIVVPELLDTLRATYARRAQHSERDVMEELASVGLLILDDLGSERASDWATERLFVLINQRHDYRRRTIITSNLPPAELSAHISERTMWRIKELAEGHIVALDGCPNLRAHLRAVVDVA
jgi:DNA replication protein DnaC